MILFLQDGNQIRGDLIKTAILRMDLAPIPMTLEADIRGGDDSIDSQLVVDKWLKLANGDKMRIVKSTRVTDRGVQAQRQMVTYRVTALLDPCCAVSFVRKQAIIKETSALSVIYRAAGATIQTIDADFPVPRFYCPVGDTPTFQIARVLQEEGGAVRWKKSKLQFMRLPDMFKQKPIMSLPDNADDDVDSGFLERHEVPWFYSLKAAGGFLYGNRDKPRVTRYAPFQDEQKLRNMTRCLVHRKVIRIGYDSQITAGDLFTIVGEDGKKTDLAVVTVAHAYVTGTDNAGEAETYSRLWLGSLED